VVDNQTDMSSCDLNRAVLSVEDDRRILNIGKRIWVDIVLQKEGVKDFPWLLSVSNKQSRALDVSSSPSFTLH
jgi:hypothetical protein